jgi:Flp pilus assembly protein TadD
VNLGVLYARHDLLEQAESAYLRALEVDEDEPSALANLALVYEALGESELASEYSRRVQGYRERNPYYHYSIAAGSIERQEWSAALAAVRKALRLKHDDPDFHELRGRALEALGRAREAAQSFELAREYAAAEAERAESRVLFDSMAMR